MYSEEMNYSTSEGSQSDDEGRSSDEVSFYHSNLSLLLDFSPTEVSFAEESVESEDEEECAELSESTASFKFPYTCMSTSDIGTPRPSSGGTFVKGKCDMLYRRPVFLPKSRELLQKYQQQLSYFSEKLAEEQFAVQHLTDCIYKFKCDVYEKCEGRMLERLHLPKRLESINGMAFSNCGKYLGIGCGCGEFKICDNEERRIYSPLVYGESSKILCVRHLPNYGVPIFIGSTQSGVILICMYENLTWLTWEYIRETPNEINSFDVNTTGSKLVSGGKDATLRLYDLRTGKQLLQFKRRDMDCDKLIEMYLNNIEDKDDGHYRRIHAIKFKDDAVFLSGGNDNTVKIWDVRSGTNPVQHIYGPHICGDSLDIFESKVLTGQWTHNESIEVWDVRTSRKLSTLSPKNRRQVFVNEFPYCCKFLRYEDLRGVTHGNGDLIGVGGSGLGAMEIQSIGLNTIVHRYMEPGHIITLAQFENLIAYGTSKGALGFCHFYSSEKGEDFDVEVVACEEEVLPEDQYSTSIMMDDPDLQGQSKELSAVVSTLTATNESIVSGKSSKTTHQSVSVILKEKSSSIVFVKPKSNVTMETGVGEEEGTISTSSSACDSSDDELSSCAEDREVVGKEKLSSGEGWSLKEELVKLNLKMLRKHKNEFLRRIKEMERISESSIGRSDSSDPESLIEYVSSDNSVFDFPSDTEFPEAFKPEE